jgi:hypothetical protein
MPTGPRRDTIDPSINSTYHVYARCVRRAFLFGLDRYFGVDFSYRRRWIRKQTKYLARYFAIDVFFFAFMSNHYHLVIRNLPNLVESWTDEDVIRRACKIFRYKFQRLGVKWRTPTAEKLKQLVCDRALVSEMRRRLADPSWFLRQLNQHIARRANDEDGCSGRFFEDRFKCNRISDSFALVICGMYLDLNEIVAGVATCAEDSTETSLYCRIRGRQLRRKGSHRAIGEDGFLCPVFLLEDDQGYPLGGVFGSHRASDRGLIDMTLPSVPT